MAPKWPKAVVRIPKGNDPDGFAIFKAVKTQMERTGAPPELQAEFVRSAEGCYPDQLVKLVEGYVTVVR